jgi:hypothetical protein
MMKSEFIVGAKQAKILNLFGFQILMVLREASRMDESLRS